MKLVLATRNTDKIKEIAAMLEALDVDVVRADALEDAPDVVEDGRDLEENALKKARALREFSGLCALADDTGLEVDALGGAPGVMSARYAGEDATYADNCRKLLGEMAGVADGERSARFRCVMALALVDEVADAVCDRIGETGGEARAASGFDRPDALVTEGIIEGVITREERGGHGFGYDPVFELVSSGRTLAELGLEEKNRVSHRYRALLEMRELMLRLGLARER